MKQKLIVTTLFCTLLCGIRAAVAKPETGEGGTVLSVDMGQRGCAISIVDFYHGHLESRMKKTAGYWVDMPPVRSTLGNFSVNFWCKVDRDFASAAQTYGALWDSSEKKWKPYYEDVDDRNALSPVSKIYQLRSKNATGFLRTTDQINGDEDQRVRFYTYCLFREKTAICGSGQSMKLEEPQGDYLPFILRILRSVSFVGEEKRGVVTK